MSDWKDTPCVLHKGTIGTGGYGRVRVNGVYRPAHRVAYEAKHGLVPAELHMDHLCRNRACVNPDHLEPVTCQENILRGEGIAAKNKVKTHCVNGHEFTPENTINARGKRNCRECARRIDNNRYPKKKEQRKAKRLAALEQVTHG